MRVFNRYKYLIAYTIPLLGFCSIHWSSRLSWLAFIFAFVCVPILDFILPLNATNVEDSIETDLAENKLFDWMLYLNLPFYFSILIYCFYKIEVIDFMSLEYIGLVLSIGILAGTIGINVAHELGHRIKPYEKIMAKSLLMTSLYMHFIIEHNKGHHKNVSTPKDPATARKGEIVYLFYFRSIFGAYRNAWKIESRRLKNERISPFSFKNEMLRFQIIQLSYLVAVYFVFGKSALIFAILIAIVGILLLESINYVEHYGLVRKKLPNGRYELQNNLHSWNSNHEVGRIILYELVRHSDHHYRTMRKYQVLRHFDESPQLPVGYPGSLILALIPPLWFSIMHPRIDKISKG